MRLYAALGVTPADVARAFALSGFRFGGAVVLLLALLLAIHPAGLPSVVSWPRSAEIASGVLIIPVLAPGPRQLALGRRRLALRSVSMDLPPPASPSA